jgi:3-hydroxyacyl-CoA dehydrogenase
MTAEYKVHGDVAVITLNNPPVNGLGFDPPGHRRRPGESANADAAVKAIVLTGAGKAFSGGADIKEFGTPKAMQEPNLLSRDPRAIENVGQAGGGRRAQRLPWAAGWSWRWAATTASRRPAAMWPARSEAGPDARRRRHAAPAARAGRGSGAEHDRQRRAGQERTAGPCCPARSCSTSSRRPKSCWPSALAFAREVADTAASPGAQPALQAPQRDAYFQFARNMVKGMSKNFPAPPSAWTRWKPPPRRSLTTACWSSARSSST